MKLPNFGITQVSNPTPSIVNTLVRAYTISGSTFIAWMQTNNLIGTHAQGTISSIVGLSLLLANALAPLFGVTINSGTVPTKDVTAVDQNSDSK